MGYLRPSRDQVWRVILEGHSGSILRSILDPFWTLSEKPHRNVQKSLHLAVGRALALRIGNILVLGLAG